MTTTDKTALHDLPLRAADYIDQHGWTQHQMEDESGAVSLTGALRACSPQPGDWTIAAAVALRRGHAESWNDERGRTAEEVTNWLRTNPITDEGLKATLGPQWHQFVALARRAAVLTGEEAEVLAAGWAARQGAAWNSAWRSVQDSAWCSLRDSAWDATWYAARGAAWNIARYATRYAAQALVVADLVGQYGLEQHHIDTLLAPWRAVIGDPLEVPNN